MFRITHVGANRKRKMIEEIKERNVALDYVVILEKT